MNDYNDVLNSLKRRRAELQTTLRRVEIAIAAFETDQRQLGKRKKHIRCQCTNDKCKKEFLAARRDAMYCSRECQEYIRKHGVTLIEGVKR